MQALDTRYIASVKLKVESKILLAMEKVYGSAAMAIPRTFRPHLKYMERVVSFYDYYACGISVLAPMAVRGNRRALKLIDNLLLHMDHYRTRIYGTVLPGTTDPWTVPLRRLIFHAALAYEKMSACLKPGQRDKMRRLLDTQARIALEHNHHFHPGVRNLYLGFANNHTAIFMQGVYHAGRVLGKQEWVAAAREAAGRLFRSGHRDGYWEENTNTRREGGPSMVYTPLTAGCLFDILDGCRQQQPAFLRAGQLYRGFLNFDGRAIPLADERTNCHSAVSMYGLALHSLTPEGRGYIRQTLDTMDWSECSPESLAVLNYELGLMRTGVCKTPEYRKPGVFRLSLPLGVVRRNGWTAGLSAMRALNRVRNPGSDYALDQQCLVYLSHRKQGIILNGVKSKNDAAFSTVARGIDAYPVDTGKLLLGRNSAVAEVEYATFRVKVRIQLGRRVRLVFETGDPREMTTTLPVASPEYVLSDTPFKTVMLKGFSPYSAGNTDKPVVAVRFAWKKRLVVEIAVSD